LDVDLPADEPESLDELPPRLDEDDEESDDPDDPDELDELELLDESEDFEPSDDVDEPLSLSPPPFDDDLELLRLSVL
jgi:hypothetical protein